MRKKRDGEACGFVERREERKVACRGMRVRVESVEEGKERGLRTMSLR